MGYDWKVGDSFLTPEFYYNKKQRVGTIVAIDGRFAKVKYDGTKGATLIRTNGHLLEHATKVIRSERAPMTISERINNLQSRIEALEAELHEHLQMHPTVQ